MKSILIAAHRDAFGLWRREGSAGSARTHTDRPTPHPGSHDWCETC
jgi:hypothetical protein